MLALYVVGVVRGTASIQTAIGIQVSWVYLRFFQRRAISETIGDDSEHFAWATYVFFLDIADNRRKF